MYIKVTNSTNSLLREMLVSGQWTDRNERFIRAGYQTAGRGQAGNGWESEPEKNLLFSVLLDTRHTPLQRQFDLNVVVSVALHRTVTTLLQHSGLTAPRSYSEAVSIKWPNDLYYGDEKLAGILVETAISGGRIEWAIGGVGLNVNQTEWIGNAPNPTSLKRITGSEYDLEKLMEDFIASLVETEKWTHEQFWTYYLGHLYRRDGYWPFVEREVNIVPTMNADETVPGQFMARIADITPDGEIVLEDKNGLTKKYHFKQIRYVV